MSNEIWTLLYFIRVINIKVIFCIYIYCRNLVVQQPDENEHVGNNINVENAREGLHNYAKGLAIRRNLTQIYF